MYGMRELLQLSFKMVRLLFYFNCTVSSDFIRCISLSVSNPTNKLDQNIYASTFIFGLPSATRYWNSRNRAGRTAKKEWFDIVPKTYISSRKTGSGSSGGSCGGDTGFPSAMLQESPELVTYSWHWSWLSGTLRGRAKNMFIELHPPLLGTLLSTSSWKFTIIQEWYQIKW